MAFKKTNTYFLSFCDKTINMTKSYKYKIIKYRLFAVSRLFSNFLETFKNNLDSEVAHCFTS